MPERETPSPGSRTTSELAGPGGASSNGGGGLGGGIQSVDGGLQISGSTFANRLAQGGTAATGNTAGIAAGGGIHTDTASSLVRTASTVKKSRALGSTGRGGSIDLEPGSGTGQIRQTVITQNVASTAGNNIYIYGPSITVDFAEAGVEGGDPFDETGGPRLRSVNPTAWRRRS